ncbi:MAG: hypothetical protein K2G30_09690, partial [Muribaculaceae bacterium]|nr:hypothetical protein [Muribaculaceae bacterium]
MDNCAAVDIYDSLKHCKGETTLPGLRPEAYYIPKLQILKYPVLPKPSDTDADMAGIATYDGDFGLAADAFFNELDILDTASNVTSASQGEKPSKTFLNSSTLKYAGTNEAATGFCRMANSDDILYVVRQRDGKYRVIGIERFAGSYTPLTLPTTSRG